MDSIKKACILAGAVIGGVVGGSISLAGKMAKVKFVDDVGSSIVSSAIHTGELTGTIAGGTVNAVSGKITKKPLKVKKGIKDLKRGGKQVADNVFANFRYVVENRKDIKKLAKFAAVGTITVGAIKMIDSDEK